MDNLRKKAIKLGATDFKKSSRKDKKWMVEYNGKWIHFGQVGYEDYTQHRDQKRRKDYLQRTRYIRDGEGNLTYNNKNKANYWARNVLW